MNKRHFLTLTTAAIGGLIYGREHSVAGQRQIQREVRGRGVNFRWRHKGGRLTGTLTAPTTGWIAVGFNEVPQLENTWFIIAAVSLLPIHVEEHIALVPAHPAVGQMGLGPMRADVRGRAENGRSTLEFSFPHRFPMRPALSLSPGSAVHLMLAWSRETDFQHHSAWRQHYDITL